MREISLFVTFLQAVCMHVHVGAFDRRDTVTPVSELAKRARGGVLGCWAPTGVRSREFFLILK